METGFKLNFLGGENNDTHKRENIYFSKYTINTDSGGQFSV